MDKKKLIITVLVWISFLYISSVMAAQVHLAWDPASGEVTGYRIYYGISQGEHPNKIEVGNVTDYIVTGLKEGITYYFVVRAYNTYGESADSNEISWNSANIDTTPPGDVSNVVFDVEENNLVRFTWQNPSDSDFAGVKVVYTTDGSEPTLNKDGVVMNGQRFCDVKIPTVTCSQKLSNLFKKEYKFAFFTYDKNGNYSHTVHVMIPAVTVNLVSVLELKDALKIKFNVVIDPYCLGNVIYEWDFDDGSKSSEQNPVHTFKLNKIKGTYDVKLTIKNKNCIIRKKITVNTPPLRPSISKLSKKF